ncbi:MAG: UDP-N-acetylglucosamine 2-epimerase [Nitrosarchaeum sp.]
MKRKILLITERRADYSKFKPILTQIKKSKHLDYYLIVTGTHLLRSHGYTINEIRRDGFKITSTFKMHKKTKKDTGAEMVKTFGRAVINLSKEIEKIKPDIILAGFDIGASLAAAITGAHMNIIVAHVEGGDVTGTIDESIRHAITKFSHIHFTSNELARWRLIKMGEKPVYVFVVGNPALDKILQIKNISQKELQIEFKIDFSKPYIIMVQHTVTSEVDEVDKNILKTIEAIKELDIQAIVVYGNADAGSKKISKILKNTKILQYPTIASEKYINLLKNASALVGNSSSGIIETPFLHVPSINIGTRQQGRGNPDSVINVGYNKNEIKKAIEKAINDKVFLKKVKNCQSLYGDGNAAKKIVKILETINLETIPVQKKLTY